VLCLRWSLKLKLKRRASRLDLAVLDN